MRFSVEFEGLPRPFMIQPVRDPATVSSDGTSLQSLPEGVTFFPLTTHLDDRGSVCELFDPRWGWTEAPFTFSYMFTLRPGMVKGWGLHKEHEDRYVTLFGEIQIVMFDAREDSPTQGQVSSVVLSHYNRRAMNIPAGIWHANWNIGSTDCVVINFPTKPYDHENPDKYRLPLDTDQIPFTFPPTAHGW